MDQIRNLLKDTRGAGVLEYVLICGLVAIVCIAAYKTFGGNVSSVVNGQAQTVNTIPQAP
jgi:Flp pilus assembly pilin Flp